MPHHQDVENDTAEMSSTYECLGCGAIVTVETHPGECSECGGEFHNRAKSLE
ncbi:MAG: rubrerythrin-like domain-containing protein [Halorhabdus sp.]